MVLGGAYRQNTDTGEVLATAARIPDGDADAWIRKWTATADGAWGAGETARHAGRRITALSFYRRAASYYSVALYCTTKAKDFDAERELATWRRHRECWEHVVDLSPVPGERIEIPYQGTMLKGYFFRAPDAQLGERRPLVIMNNGSDGATSGMWGHGGAAAGERGYQWMTFDGPGQQYALYEQGIPFRHDWEAVPTPVVDALISRTDVHSDRMAVIGISQGGYWVPRALAFEHRLAAAVADGGAVDISRSWLQPPPAALREMLDSDRKDAFDATMRKAAAANPAVTATLEFRGRPYGTNGSRYDLYKAVSAYRLGNEVNDITTPMLVCAPDDDQLLPGQSQELYDRLPGEKKLVRFTAEEGAHRHCEPMGVAIRDARIFDWLEGYLSI